MCRRLVRPPVGLVAVLGLSLGLASGAVAQSVDEQVRRVDSAVVAWRAAEARRRQFEDSVRAEAPRPETVDAPPFRIVTLRVDEEDRALVARAAGVAADSLRLVAGAATARVVTRVIRAEMMRDTTRLTFGVPAGWRSGSSASAPLHADSLSRALAAVGIATITGSAGRAFRDWVGDLSRLDPPTAEDWARARLLLISLDTLRARACHEGQLTACRALLFDDARMEVHAFRSLLAHTALEIGGGNALERLVLTEGTPAERLEAAAGAPMDSVIAQWLGHVRAARVPSAAMSAGVAATGIFWTIVFGALSLRSSRWR